MANRTHKPEPVQYLYRDHFITREDAADYVVAEDAGIDSTDVGWLISLSDGGGIVGVGQSVDDCMAAIDETLDDA